MSNLQEELSQFIYKGKRVEELTSKFEQLAPYFLYSGYIRVLGRFRVYIQRVEFYFHSETDGIQDEIVYHRNNYHIIGKLPYFTPITFHAHASGYDIAFENAAEQYRASALIRAYEVYDEQEHKYLKASNGKFDYTENPYTNIQSTYLYDILNGFGDAGTIEWVHKPSVLFNNHQPLKQEWRKGVYVGDKWKGDEYKEPRERNWSFSRKEFIEIL